MSSVSKTVLITGATRGIGLAFVEYFVVAGWKVIATARDVRHAHALKALSPFKIVQLEASDEDSIKRMAEELHGVPIDLLINNAGILEEGDFETTTKESLMRQFEVNSVAPFLVTRALLNNLQLASRVSSNATVMSISSMLASITTNSSNRYGYRSSKTALNMINSCLAIDLKNHDIVAIVIQPGFVNTDLNGHKGVVEPMDSVLGMAKVIMGSRWRTRPSSSVLRAPRCRGEC